VPALPVREEINESLIHDRSHVAEQKLTRSLTPDANIFKTLFGMFRKAEDVSFINEVENRVTAVYGKRNDSYEQIYRMCCTARLPMERIYISTYDFKKRSIITFVLKMWKVMF